MKFEELKVGDVVKIIQRDNDWVSISEVINVDLKNYKVGLRDLYATNDDCIYWNITDHKMEIFKLEKILTKEESLKYLI